MIGSIDLFCHWLSRYPFQGLTAFSFYVTSSFTSAIAPVEVMNPNQVGDRCAAVMAEATPFLRLFSS